jgi:iron complex outermembrane receptor protein
VNRLALSFAFATTIFAHDLFALEGSVLRGDASPAAGVTVSIAGESRAVRTGANGRFTIEPDPRFPARLVVTDADGSTSMLDLPAPPAHPVEIVVGLVASETITVSGAAAPHIDAPPAAAADTLSSDDLASLAPVHVADAVATIPGVSASDGGPSSVPSVRGLARGRTLMLLDGARVSTERRAGSSAGFVNPFTLASVEVARGPGSVAYGSDALGGVIHLRSREPSADEPAIRFEAGAMTGGEEIRSLGAELGFRVGDGGGLLAIYGRDGDDGEDGDGRTIENSSFRDYGFAARASRVGSFGVFVAGLGVDRGRDLERPAPPDDPARTSYPIEESDRLTASVDSPGSHGWSSFRFTGFAGRYRQTLDRSTPTAAGGVSISSSDNESWDAALRASAERSLGNVRLETGIDLAARLGLESLLEDTVVDPDGTVVSSTDSVAIENASRFDTGAFVSGDLALGPRSWVSAGIRADSIAAENDGGYFGDRSDRDSALSGHAALSLRSSDSLVTTLQVARGFRAPTLSDRYYRGPSGRGYVTGNPLLEPETTLQFDGSSRWQRGSSSVALFAYLYRIDDLIERYRDGTSFYFRNRGEAEIRGLELEAEGTIGANLAARISASYSRGEARDGSETPLDDIAPPNARAELRWRRGATTMTGAVSWFDDDTRPGPSEVERSGFTTLDLSFSRQLTRALDLRVVAGNLTDAAFYASADSISALAPGRTFGLTLAGRFPR